MGWRPTGEQLENGDDILEYKPNKALEAYRR